MKHLITWAFMLTATYTFAQGSGSKNKNSNAEPTLVKVAVMMTDGMCNCFNTHVVDKLSENARKGIDKIVKKGITSTDDLGKVLSEEELIAIATESNTFTGLGEDEDSSPFDACCEKTFGGLEAYAVELAPVMEKLGQEGFEKELTNQMEVRMRQNKKDCGTFYGFYLIGKKQK